MRPQPYFIVCQSNHVHACSISHISSKQTNTTPSAYPLSPHLTRHTSDQIINPDVPPVYDHADISIPWGEQNVHGTAPEDVAVAVDVPGRSQQVVCSTVSDCSQVIQFPLEDSGKSLTYEVRVAEDATDGTIVWLSTRAASWRKASYCRRCHLGLRFQ